ncbi:hypothetical protein [Streptomyces tardus]|nr:hypothetical protein [Streptomyces tardus]
MRPARFQDFVLDLARIAPDGGQPKPLADVGEKRYPYGVVAHAGGKEIRYQIIAESRAGDDFDQPEKIREADQAFDPDAVPAGGLFEERWLAELVAKSGTRELTDIAIWSAREGNRKGNDGVTFFFADSAKIYARVVR